MVRTGGRKAGGRRRRAAAACLALCVAAALLAWPGPALPLRAGAAGVFSVTTSADSGPGSLRQAIADCNAAAGGEIVFDAAMAGATVTLLSELPAIAHATTLTGPAGGVTLTAGIPGGWRHFRIGAALAADADFDVSMSGLVLLGPGIGAGGAAQGENGGIFAGGAGQVLGDTYDQPPYFEGTLALYNCTVSGSVNRDTSAGTGMASGGGINLLGRASALVLEGCTLAGNGALFAGGGVCAAGTLEATDCIFTGNEAQNMAGAVFTFGLAARGCTFSGNRALAGSGGAVVTGDNTDGGSAVVAGCTFAGNRASMAGGSGGGLAAVHRAEATNCTFTDNEARFGGGLFAYDAAIASCTITGNRALVGAGVNAETSAAVAASIVAGNAPAARADQAVVAGGALSDPDTDGDGISDRFNIVGTDAFSVGDLFGANALAGNGGPTETILPAAGGPAPDAIPPAEYTALLSPAPAADQRGVARPQGAGVDIGAVELAPSAPPPAPAGGTAPSPQTGDGSRLPWWAALGGATLAGLAVCGAGLGGRAGRRARR